MQPYQQAGEEHLNQRERPFKAANDIATLVAPFMSTYVPAKLAMVGLGKIDARLGKFFEHATSLGYGANEVKDFIKDKVQQENPQNKAPNQRNIIEQYSPELFQHLKDLIQSGQVKSPTRAADIVSKAYNKKHLQPIIKKIEEDHKTPFASIVESIFGGGQMAQQPQGQQQPEQQVQQQQPASPQGQGGPGQQALMHMLDKINQKLGQ